MPPFNPVKLRNLQLFDLYNLNRLAGKSISLKENR